MSGWSGWIVRIGAGAAATVAIVGLSQVPWSAAPSDDGALRLAWRYRSALVDECRSPSPEELARLPAHMRQQTICERRLVPYVLTVEVDGVALRTDTIHAGGARADRPLSLFRESPLTRGRHTVRIVFAPLASGTAEQDDEDKGDERRPTAPTLVLDTTFTIQTHRVALVTLDDARGTLTMRR